MRPGAIRDDQRLSDPHEGKASPQRDEPGAQDDILIVEGPFRKHRSTAHDNALKRAEDAGDCGLKCVELLSQ